MLDVFDIIVLISTVPIGLNGHSDIEYTIAWQLRHRTVNQKRHVV